MADLSSKALGGQPLRTSGRHFVDGYGRIVQMRGFNVSGACKLPINVDANSQQSPDEFFDHKNVSFVGRPFPLAKAPFHFARLRAWGHTLIRLTVTWEALSHSGPGELDEEYIAYLEALLDLMPRYGIKCIICAHQDVWSRYSGGSGAPGWTFEKAGFDMRAFKATGAAFVSELEGSSKEEGSKTSNKAEPVGPFLWPSNYQKLAPVTMATLFWAGDIFAWKLKLKNDLLASQTGQDDISIREYLQTSYIEAFGRLADALAKKEALVGFDVINEPHRGAVGLRDWQNWNYNTDLHIGFYPNFLQSLALGSGYCQRVPFYVKSWPFPTKVSHHSLVDPLGTSCWHSDAEEGGMGQCIWRAHGVWEWDQTKKHPVVLCDNFFERDPRPGKDHNRIEWYRDCYAPFLERFMKRIRQSNPRLLCFVEPIPNEFFPPWASSETMENIAETDRRELMTASYDQGYATKTFVDTVRPEGFVYAPHFYDLNVLFSKTHNEMSVNVQGLSRGAYIWKAIYFGRDGLKKNYLKQLSNVKKYGKLSFGPTPTIVGEVGVPFDINNRESLLSGNYALHEELLDALIEAMEHNELHFTLWNYDPNNTTAHGDGWNNEDFSIVCFEKGGAEDRNRRKMGADDELYEGGRALAAVIRPYAAKIAGLPIESKWDSEAFVFTFKFANSVPFQSREGGEDVPDAKRTEIFVPKYQFGTTYEGLRIQVSDGTYELDAENQTLYYTPEKTQLGYPHTIRISTSCPPAPHVLKRKRARISRWWPFNAESTFTLLMLSIVLAVILFVADDVYTRFVAGTTHPIRPVP